MNRPARPSRQPAKPRRETGASLKERLATAEETLRALSSGAVDAIVTSGPAGNKVFTLEGADHAYRLMVEAMSEGAVTLNLEGSILYSNRRFAELIGRPLDQVIGVNLGAFVASHAFVLDEKLQREAAPSSVRERIDLKHANGTIIPSYIAMRRQASDGSANIVCVVTDLTELFTAQAQLQHMVLATVESLSSAMELRDPYTTGHQRRVAQLAAAMARRMKLPEHEVEGIHLAAALHDLGKISIPAEILAKPGRLSAIEYDLMKTHPDAGYEILKKIEFKWPIAEMVLQHHERLDGLGYPQGLKGEDILIGARIIAVADVTESMTSFRPYRPALGLDAALAELRRGKGRVFDPSVVTACESIFHEGGFKFE